MIPTVGKRFRRALHFDFHTSPGIKNILANFDAEKFAKQLSDAHIEYVNVAARCNMGYSYYNTKVGKKYEGLGERDPLDEIIKACKEKDIGVTAYLNVGLCHDFAADNYGWLRIGRNGEIYKETTVIRGNFFRSMCYNSDYRAHLLEEIREIAEYDIDGIFCDCCVFPECFCPRCVADMTAKGVNMEDKNAVLAYQNEVRYGLAEDIKRAIGEKNGKIKVFINGTPLKEEFKTHAEIECLTTDPQWGYDYFEPLAAYARTKFDDRVYMSGRFQNSWGDFGGIKPLASMQNDLYDAMMNCYGISYGDHLHPVDGFEPEVMRRIAAVMEEKMAYEPYGNTDYSDNLTEVGILVKESRISHKLPYYVAGAARMLKELKLTYSVYDETGDFEKSRLLIIAESEGFDDALVARLKAYAGGGGKIIFAGSGVELGVRAGLLDFIELAGRDTADNAYFTTEGCDMRFAVYEPLWLIKNKSGVELAKDVRNLLNFTWDGRQSCFYRPQGTASEYSAAAAKDNVACISFDIFKSYADNFLVEQRELFDKTVRHILDKRYVESPEMPKTATVALTTCTDGCVFHIKATYPEHKMSRGIIEEHTYMKSVPVSIEGEYEVYKLPEKTPVEYRHENGRTVFESGDILGYRAFLLI